MIWIFCCYLFINDTAKSNHNLASIRQNGLDTRSTQHIEHKPAARITAIFLGKNQVGKMRRKGRYGKNHGRKWLNRGIYLGVYHMAFTHGH